MPEVTRSRVGSNTLLAPDGPLNEAARIEILRAALGDCVAQRERQVLLDLAAVPVMASGALEVILDGQDALARAGGSLAVANLGGTVRAVLELTGVADQVSILGSAEDVSAAPTDGQARRGRRERRIGEILVERGHVTAEQVEEALQLQAQTGQRMASIMLGKGWLPEAELLSALSDQLGLPFVTLRSGLYDPGVARLLDADVAQRLKVLPLFRVRGELFLATPDPQSLPSMETVEDLTGLRVKPVLACTDDILKSIGEAAAEGADLAEYIGDLETDLELVETVSADDQAIDRMADGSPVINLINGLIQRAVRDKASDIHIEPMRRRCRVRLRVDGVLYAVMTPPLEVHPALVSRLKVMANLDIAERRLPQDGRIQVMTGGRAVDLRFSSLPGIFGEKVVLRVLDKSQSILEVDKLGLHESNLERFRRLLKRSYGLIMVTGPTGSGKTTTLYAALDELNSDERNVITIEDPVEYQVDGITQNNVRENIGLTFSRVLKHVLRQDPDVIMVGEIRERETAEIAVQAALTGHLVLSTLHTNDGIGAVTRMLDMGVEPFLLSSALSAVIAQRLIRTVCSECRTSHVVPADSLAQYGVEVTGQQRLSRGRGCPACYDSGYKGRLAIHELIECDPALQRLIVSNPARDDLEQHVRSTGIRTLFRDGVDRALAGETTFEEVLRVVNS